MGRLPKQKAIGDTHSPLLRGTLVPYVRGGVGDASPSLRKDL
jgi:hypothetical protein